MKRRGFLKFLGLTGAAATISKTATVGDLKALEFHKKKPEFKPNDLEKTETEEDPEMLVSGAFRTGINSWEKI